MRPKEMTMPEDDDELRAKGVEEMPGFDALTDHDKVELVKFEHYLRVAREPKQPIEGAYAHVYGEVVRDDPRCPRVSCHETWDDATEQCALVKAHEGPCRDVYGRPLR